MTTFPSLPLWTDALLGDTGHLTDCEFGSYMRLLILIWRSPNCRIPNDDAWIARRFRRSVQEFEITIKPIMQEYCRTDGNWVSQKRLTKEWEYVQKARARAIDLANRRWHKEKDLCHGNAPTPTPIKKEVSKEVSTGKKILPDDWKPTDGHFQLGQERGLSREEVIEAAAEMRDWSLGKGERRRNWDSVFSNWMRNNARRKGNGHGYGRPRPLQDDSLSISKAGKRLIEANQRGEFDFAPRPRLFPDQSDHPVQLLPEGRSARS